MMLFDAALLKLFRKSFGYKEARESDKPAMDWLEASQRVFGHYIDGEWVHSAQTFPTLCPATKEVLAHVAYGTAENVDMACKAAERAFPQWAALSGFERSKYLYAIARAIARHLKLFSVLEALDNGKVFREPFTADVPLSVRHAYHHAGWAQLCETEFPGMAPGGVVGQIIPWNFPLLMAMWMICPSLAAGNTVVLKPAEFTPLTAALLAQILRDEVKLPPGVVNIVFGDGATGEALVKHPIPWKESFTGSTEVGRKIREATAGSGKRLKLELGGKSPFIVCADADLDSVVEGVINAIFFNKGEVCCAGSRLLVHASIKAKLVRKLKRRMAKLRAGHPLDKTADIGAVNSEAQYQKVLAYIQIGQAEGAKMWQPMGYVCPTEGWYVPPTLFDGVQPSMRIAREEIFGSVLVVIPFSTTAQAIALANNTEYGLAASVWGQDVDTITYIAAALKAGVVWVNDTNKFDACAPFGGRRFSGYGRQGGREGMEEELVEGEWPYRSELPPISHEPNLEQRLEPDGKIDRTLRFLIGSELRRPDGQLCFRQMTAWGDLLAMIGDANRKDERDAVAAARKAAEGWAGKSAHNRAQILYFLGENLAEQTARFADAIVLQTGRMYGSVLYEVDLAVERLFLWAAWADKFGGTVQSVPGRVLVPSLNEPIGVVGVRAPDAWPLLGFVNAIAPAVAMGNTVVAVAGKHPLSAMDFVGLVQMSDVPAGVINILAAKDPDAVSRRLAAHEDVDALWHFGSKAAGADVERLSTCNLKRTWVLPEDFDWMGDAGASRRFLHEATQSKTVWLTYGI